MSNQYLSEEIKLLINRFLKGVANEQEVEILQQWLTSNESNRILFDQINQQYQASITNANINASVRTKAWKKLTKRIQKEESPSIPITQRYLLSPVKVAAAITIAVLLGYTTLQLLKNSGQLPNDKRIVQTAQEKNIHLYLPDSTQVWLNKNSTLEYPAVFDKKSRLVVLKGEAFFDVQKNGTPFIVQTEKVQVLVKGTRFNIQAYKNEAAIRTTLEEGKVELSVENNTNHYVMAAGDQITLDKPKNQITRSKVDPSNFSAWKEVRLVFDNASLKEIAAKLENRFRTDIMIARSAAQNERFSLTIENESLEEILELIRLSSNLQISVDNKRVLIY